MPQKGESQYLTESFNSFVVELMAEWKVLGASLAIVDGHDIHTKAFGLTQPGGSPVDEHTLFNAASMSKSFTAGAVAMLVDDNERYSQVQWDTKVSDLLPDVFVLHDPYCTKNVTIADILSHRTGVPGHDDSFFDSKSSCQSTPQSTTKTLRHFPNTKPLRSIYQYNNMMYIAASYLVESLAGKPFIQFLKERFWTPLQMNHTSFGYRRHGVSANNSEQQMPEISPGFYWDSQNASYIELPPFDDPQGQGAGNIVSNALDWARWVRSMIEGTSGISIGSIAELIKPRILVDDSKTFGSLQRPDFYGMGWHIYFYRGYRIVSHAGGIPGHSSLMIWLPEQKWGFVVFGNSNNMDIVGPILGWTLVDAVLRISDEHKIDWAQQARGGRRNSDSSEENEDEAASSAQLPPQGLTAYTGLYYNPVYHELSVCIEERKLFIDASSRMFGFTLTFRHLSENFFLAERAWKPRFSDDRQTLEVMFEMNSTGRAERMGIDFVNQQDSALYIWFTRNEGKEEIQQP